MQIISVLELKQSACLSSTYTAFFLVRSGGGARSLREGQNDWGGSKILRGEHSILLLVIMTIEALRACCFI